jgi:two-component system alkaline phosphatase synthesis response regulator PhoP
MNEKSVQNVLLIFSDKEKQAQVKNTFQVDQFHVMVSNSGEEAIELMKKVSPALIVMDVVLDGMDGIETCQVIRKELNLVDPVIVFLTDRNEDYTQIAAYDAGADDYLPFSMRSRLLVSKVNTLLHRKDLCCPPEKNTEHGPLVIDRSKFIVHYLDREYTLPRKEFLLLEALAEVKGKVINREQLMKMVWNDHGNIGDRTIDVHIRKIREKISIDLIRTIKGVGYQLNVSAVLK